MGTPASSALRADNATNAAAMAGADGDAFGSLTGLGGPRKFKKKPVLVLDPEELERAHMMFQEASAELLGEEVERAPKPATSMLGLAPMDDDDATPEDMGLSDDDQDGGDDEAIPTGEDLLRTNSSRPVEDEAEQEFAMRALEEGFDEEHRIFPSLPVLPEEDIAFEEAAELSDAQMPEAELPVEPVETSRDIASEGIPAEEPTFKLSPLSAGETEPEDEDEEPESSDHFAALSPQIRRETPVRPQEPVEAEAAPVPEPEPEPAAASAVGPEPIPEPEQLEIDPWDNEPAPIPEEVAPLPAAGIEPDPEPEPAPEPLTAEEPAPRIEDAPEEPPISQYIGPFEHQRAAKSRDEQVPADDDQAPVPGFSATSLPPAAPTPPAFEPEQELPPVEQEAMEPAAIEPAPAPAEPEPVEAPRPFVADDGPRWQPEGYDAPDEAVYQDEQPEVAPESDADFETEEAFFEEVDEASGNYTVIEDEPVDGYAFMYADNPRGRALRSVAPGEANSLRARLVREREELQAQAEMEPASGSVVMRFWNWLRGLFG